MRCGDGDDALLMMAMVMIPSCRPQHPARQLPAQMQHPASPQQGRQPGRNGVASHGWTPAGNPSRRRQPQPPSGASS